MILTLDFNTLDYQDISRVHPSLLPSPSSKMNKLVKNRRRESLLSERLGEDSTQMGWSFLRRPAQHESELSRHRVSFNRTSSNQLQARISDRGKTVLIR